MIRRPPRSTLDRSSAASDVYKRQAEGSEGLVVGVAGVASVVVQGAGAGAGLQGAEGPSVSYTHLRAHETVLDLVCRLLLEKKKTSNKIKIKTKITYNTMVSHYNKNKAVYRIKKEPRSMK